MYQVRDKSVEVSKSDPCPICDKPDWCMHLEDGSAVCGRVDIPPDGWIRSKATAKDGRAIFHPKRNEVRIRPNRLSSDWRDRSVDTDTDEREIEIIFPYSEHQRVIRRQWTDRREVYSLKGKPARDKLVLPQFWSDIEDKWKWGRGPDEWPLFRIDDVQPTDVLFYVGGEKCVEALRSYGFSATCNQGGEGNYTSAVIKQLEQTKFLMLVIIPDNDTQGDRSAARLMKEAVNVGIPTAILSPLKLNPEAGEKWDVADWDVSVNLAQSIIRGAVAELQPTLRQSSVDTSKLDALEAEIKEVIAIRRPSLRILRERQLMTEYGLRQSELKELKGYVSHYGESSSNRVGDTFSEVFEDMERASRGEIEVTIPSGFESLDNVLGGFEKGAVITVGGKPGMGKSAFALNCATNVASTGKKVMYFSFEMLAKELIRRLIGTTISVESGRIKRGNLTTKEWENFFAVSDYIAGLPLTICNPVPATMESIETELENNPDTELVIIDYLQLMHGPGGSPLEVLQNLTKNIKLNALFRNLPIMVLSQLSRADSVRASKRPQVSDLRGSGTIEQDADQIILLYREEVDNPDTSDPGIGELNVAKNRNGGTGVVKLSFDGRFTRFSNLH